MKRFLNSRGVTMNKGWRYESIRHSLARRGIRTVPVRAGRLATVRGVKIMAEPVPKGQIYPVSPNDVKKLIERKPVDDTKGLTKVEFVPPRDKQEKGAWARYVRSKRKMLIFSQPVNKEGQVAGEDPDHVREYMTGYVLPHELGHHVALERRKITDGKLETAEARADGYAAGMDVEDKDIKMFESRHKDAAGTESFARKLTEARLKRQRLHEKYGLAGERQLNVRGQPEREVRKSLQKGDVVEIALTGAKGPGARTFPGLDTATVKVVAIRGNKYTGEVVLGPRFANVAPGKKLRFTSSNVAGIVRKQ